MTHSPASNVSVIDRFASSHDLRAAFVEGLAQPQKALPCHYFYDQCGSALFEKITEQPEYYPTRVETRLLEAKAGTIAAATPPGSVLIEYGSGSSRKTEILLNHLTNLAAYVPVDVSSSALLNARLRLRQRFPALNVVPIEGDFSQTLDLPKGLAKRPRLGFFPGSTIGNFAPTEARELLAQIGTNLENGSRLIVGVDLIKDENLLIAAYNDKAGVTATFNLNLLERANREIEADFNLTQFAHQAIFNKAESRVEMHLVSLRKQIVNIGSASFTLQEGERIHTENSYKFTLDQFQALAKSAGWLARDAWTDQDQLFSLHDLVYAAD